MRNRQILVCKTPQELSTDGCTMPEWLKPLMNAKLHFATCKRHDFECRYSLYPWWSANLLLAWMVWRNETWLGKWRAFAYFLAVTFFWWRCAETASTNFRPEWVPFIEREYEVVDLGG